jgi:uncharacterized RDD family membrane protein YckC
MRNTGIPGSTILLKCGAPLGDQGFESENKEERSQPTPPPQNSAPQYVPTLHASYEGVAIRFVAILIDWIIIGVITSIINLPLTFGGIMNNVVVTVSNATGQGTVSGGPSVALWGWVGLVGLAVPFLYYTLLQGKYGQSVGMMAVKIKVVNEDGSPIDHGAAAVRTVLMIIDAIPYFVPYLLGAILVWSSGKKAAVGRQGRPYYSNKSLMGFTPSFIFLKD